MKCITYRSRHGSSSADKVVGWIGGRNSGSFARRIGQLLFESYGAAEIENPYHE